MKTTKNVFLAMLALTLLSTPALAQKTRSNKGGQDAGNVGDERAAQVHMLNQSKKKKKKKDKDHDPAASTNKTKGVHGAMGHHH